MEGGREGGGEEEREVRQWCGGAAAARTAARQRSMQQRKHARSHLTSATKRRLNLRRGRCDAEVRPSLLCRGAAARICGADGAVRGSAGGA